MSKKTLRDVDLKGKRVLMRVDFSRRSSTCSSRAAASC